jgi:hypothetical protein
MNATRTQNESETTMNIRNVETVGHLSARCNLPLYAVLNAMQRLGVHPAILIDDVPHLDVRDAQRVAEVLQPKPEARQSTPAGDKSRGGKR